MKRPMRPLPPKSTTRIVTAPPPGPLMSWISRMGPTWLITAPANACSRQNARSNRTTTFVIAPIHTGVVAAIRAVDSGSGGRNVIPSAASGGGIAITTAAAPTTTPRESTSPSTSFGSPWIPVTGCPRRTVPAGSMPAMASASVCIPSVRRPAGPSIGLPASRCTPLESW